MVLDTLDVTAVTAAAFAAGDPVLEVVIGRISVGETVRHDQVEDILGGEALGAELVVAAAELEGLLGRGPAFLELEGQRARPGR